MEISPHGWNFTNNRITQVKNTGSEILKFRMKKN